MSTSFSAADGDAATVTLYRHTMRSLFAYEVTRERAAPAPPRGAKTRDAPAAGKVVGAKEESRPDDWSAIATVAVLDDPHAKLDKDRGSDETTGVEEEKAAVDMEEQEQEPQLEKPHEQARAAADLRPFGCLRGRPLSRASADTSPSPLKT